MISQKKGHQVFLLVVAKKYCPRAPTNLNPALNAVQEKGLKMAELLSYVNMFH